MEGRAAVAGTVRQPPRARRRAPGKPRGPRKSGQPRRSRRRADHWPGCIPAGAQERARPAPDLLALIAFRGLQGGGGGGVPPVVLTVIGAAYLTTICLIPEIALSQAGVPFYLGGTSLLIVVNVTMDTVSQIQSHLIAHQYGDLIKKAKLKGGRPR